MRRRALLGSLVRWGQAVALASALSASGCTLRAPAAAARRYTLTVQPLWWWLEGVPVEDARFQAFARWLADAPRAIPQLDVQAVQTGKPAAVVRIESNELDYEAFGSPPQVRWARLQDLTPWLRAGNVDLQALLLPGMSGALAPYVIDPKDIGRFLPVGGTWAVPLLWSNLAVLANVDLCARLGIALPESLPDVQALYALLTSAAQALAVRPHLAASVLDVFTSASTGVFLGLWQAAGGPELTGSVEDALPVDAPGGAEAVRTYAEIAAFAGPGVFQLGQCPFAFLWGGTFGGLPGLRPPGARLRLLPFPLGRGGTLPRYAWGVGVGRDVDPDTAQRAAIPLLRWLLDPEQQKVLVVQNVAAAAAAGVDSARLLAGISGVERAELVAAAPAGVRPTFLPPVLREVSIWQNTLVNIVSNQYARWGPGRTYSPANASALAGALMNQIRSANKALLARNATLPKPKG